MYTTRASRGISATAEALITLI